VPALPDSSFPDPGLDGIEAACGAGNRATAPPGTVGLRLSMPLCWREAWLGLEEASKWLARVWTKDELIEHMTVGLEEARRLRVKYVVIRASHGTWEGILTGRHAYTDYDVLMALADWVYMAAGGSDHGYDLLFENTWHAGLRWNEPRLAEQFLAKLRHPRAGFAFDVAHYLLVSGGTTTETQDLRKLKNFAKTLGPAASKVRALVLHRPGKAPVASDLVKKLRASDDARQKEIWARKYDADVDAKQPWVSAPLKELVEIVNPAYVVHRLAGEGEEWAKAVKRQDALVKP
jgi:hypothetical protein